MLALIVSAAGISNIDLDYSDPDAGTAYVLTRGLRLGDGPGRDYRFLLDFDPSGRSSLIESNSLFSRSYGVQDDSTVFDVISTPTLALNATFDLNPGADISTISFYGMAAAFEDGAHICRRVLAPGFPPPHCTTGKTAEGVCDADVGCYFSGKTKRGKERKRAVHRSPCTDCCVVVV